MVPILYIIFTHVTEAPETAMHVAVASSLAVIALSGRFSARLHDRMGNVDRTLFRLWLPGLLLGSILGAVAASFLPGSALRLMFGVFALLSAFYFGFRPSPPRKLYDLPSGRRRHRVLSFGVSSLASALGLGGGSVTFPILALGGISIRTAIGTSAAFGFVVALPSVIVYLLAGLAANLGWMPLHHGNSTLPPASLGYVNLLAVAALAPMTMLATPWGAKLAKSLDPSVLQRLFAIVQAVVASRMLWSYANGG